MPAELAVVLSTLYWPLAALLAIALDACFGELRRAHPLVGFGRLAQAIESMLNPRHRQTRRWLARLCGLLSWCLAVLPWVALAVWAHSFAGWNFLVDSLLFYFALGKRSLGEHALAVATPLAAGDLAEGRRRVGWMVSRDTSALDEAGVARATVESVLENGNDAVFATFFWFALLGGPGALLFRLANTLDAMWGYRNARFLSFGWAAARIDDVLNWIPARLTALTYAVLGQTKSALACWRQQAPHWDSPNAGPVMAAGAGSLGVLLGGAAIYHGQQDSRPALGQGRSPTAADIRSAVQLVSKGLWLWLLLFIIFHLIAAISP